MKDAAADPNVITYPFESPELVSDPDRFLSELPRPHLERQLFMFSHGFDPAEAEAAILALDAVLFTETLERDMSELGDRLGLRLELRRSNRSTYRGEWSAAVRDRARELLAAEYLLFDRLLSAR